MRHRHSGPKVKYKTRRGNIKLRERPKHTVSVLTAKKKKLLAAARKKRQEVAKFIPYGTPKRDGSGRGIRANMGRNPACR